MPNSKNPNAYGFEFHSLCELDLHRLPIHIEFPTPQAAQHFRIRTYGFVNAMANTHGETDPRVTKLRALLLKLQRHSSIITIVNRDSEGDFIIKQLEEQGAFQPRRTFDDSTAAPTESNEEAVARILGLTPSKPEPQDK